MNIIFQYNSLIKNITKNNDNFIKIETVLNIKNIQKYLEKNNFILNEKFKLNKIKNEYFLYKFQDITQLSKYVEKYPLLTEYSKYLSVEFHSENIIEIIKFLYIEYFVLIDCFNLKYITKNELISELKILSNNKKNETRNNNYFITNKQSFELNNSNEKEFIKGMNKNIKFEIVKEFKKSGITLLEIPFQCKYDKLLLVLKQINTIKKKLNIKLDFKLRFKKTLKINKYGIYNFELNTIVLDSRYTEYFIHELGHFIYENKIQTKYKKINKLLINCNSEEFANYLEKYINI